MRRTNITIRRRIWIAFIMCMLMICLLGIRLGYVQLWKGPEITRLAEDNWRRNIPFAAKRGDITDRNGIKLTYSTSTPTIMAIPVQIKDPQGAATQLARVLHASPDHIYKQITKRALIQRIQPSGRQVSIETANAIRALQIPGIVVAEDHRRTYPFGTLAAHILGFSGIDNQGLTGIEAKYNQELMGISGNISFMADAAGRELRGMTQQYAKPKDGLNLQLTMDVHLQSVLERELDQVLIQYQPLHVIAMMMDPRTGEILAMGSRPTYDPDKFKSYPAHIYNRNLPIWMTYEPGSTFKIITLAAAIEENKVDLHHEHFHDPGFIRVAGARLRCWKRGGHGHETFLQVVENSCNPGFVVMGQRLGQKKLFEYITRFGFGRKTGIDLAGEANGIMFKPSKVGPVELATTSFGQGVSVTPIQQISAVSAAINGGLLFQPYIAKAWQHPETGEVIHMKHPKLLRRVISEDTSQKIREALESVVAKGTGRNAFLDGYRIGGKTGTAQKVIQGRYSASEHIVSFIGFAPANDPQIVIYVAVDNPKGIQFGGVVAAPIVKNMMADALRYLKVATDNQQMTRAYRYGETPVVDVPDLTGFTLEDIHHDLQSQFSIVSSGQGSYVISQVPKPGSRIERGSTIRIFLSDHKP
jgi:stage V sporulation protein D (sporulation-specific penicillin-binding protein)